MIGMLGSQALHFPSKNFFVTPSLPTVRKCFRRTIFLPGIRSAQDIAIDEENSAQYAPVTDARLAVGLWIIGFQTRHLRICRSEMIREVHRSFFRPENHVSVQKSMGPDPNQISNSVRSVRLGRENPKCSETRTRYRRDRRSSKNWKGYPQAARPDWPQGKRLLLPNVTSLRKISLFTAKGKAEGQLPSEYLSAGLLETSDQKRTGPSLQQ
ncbi:hypothetical protein SAMN05444279_1189 [Ruegeria intermedia]|uniref:Uncharacterized protein n=1 Tax=Ruegeria intermedia TaxID=996115 RepID=A0A1M4Z4H8_9RHOB|nr:hypothetical protein SAMN05444279_1189 [Ruegeria intermedia]